MAQSSAVAPPQILRQPPDPPASAAASGHMGQTHGCRQDRGRRHQVSAASLLASLAAASVGSR
ncbi:unnamed protein product, partial [Polarella glacialis]